MLLANLFLRFIAVIAFLLENRSYFPLKLAKYTSLFPNWSAVIYTTSITIFYRPFTVTTKDWFFFAMMLTVLLMLMTIAWLLDYFRWCTGEL